MLCVRRTELHRGNCSPAVILTMWDCEPDVLVVGDGQVFAAVNLESLV